MYCNFLGILFLHTVITLLVAWLLLQEFVCIDDFGYNVVACHPVCNYGKFSLFGMAFCHPWLSCTEIDQIQIVEEISHGAVKRVHYCRYALCLNCDSYSLTFYVSPFMLFVIVSFSNFHNCKNILRSIKRILLGIEIAVEYFNKSSLNIS